MARKDKPIKIKRYKNSMGGSTKTKFALRRFIPFVLAAVLVVAMGFFLGKPILDFISGIGNREEKPEPSQTVTDVQPTRKPEATPVPVQPTARPTAQPTSEPVVPETVTDKKYFYANTAAMTNEAGLASVIAKAKAAGATHLVFDVKNADGYLHYTSANRYGAQLTADAKLDLSAVAQKLKAEGITPVARIYTFMDKMISTVERTTAVMYLGTESRWLDTSAALGGKSWANPASKAMQDYVIAITDEVMSMGIREFIFAGFHTPTGYSLDKRDFGASMDQVLANMKSLLGTLKAKISAKDGSFALQVEYSAIMLDGNYAQYIVHPYQLGAENYIVTAKGGDIDVAAAVSQLISAESKEDISTVTLWLTDNTASEEAKTLGNYFVF